MHIAKKPKTPKQKVLYLEMNASLHRRIAELARQSGRSMNQEAIRRLRATTEHEDWEKRLHTPQAKRVMPELGDRAELSATLHTPPSKEEIQELTTITKDLVKMVSVALQAREATDTVSIQEKKKMEALEKRAEALGTLRAQETPDPASIPAEKKMPEKRRKEGKERAAHAGAGERGGVSREPAAEEMT